MSFTDENVSTTMNVFLVIANIINLVYNVPQVVKTYKTKSTKDFSTWFIFMRIIGNTIWLAYSFEINSIQLIINNIVTVAASLFIGYYKYQELYKEYKLIHKDTLSDPMIPEDSINDEIILDFRNDHYDNRSNVNVMVDENMMNNAPISNIVHPYIKYNEI